MIYVLYCRFERIRGHSYSYFVTSLPNSLPTFYINKYCNDYMTTEKRITHYCNETIKYKIRLQISSMVTHCRPCYKKSWI